MPSVLGLARDVAQTVLNDAGLTEVVAAIAQRPSPGTDPATIFPLAVSTPAALPDPLGKQSAEELSQLGTFGANVIHSTPTLRGYTWTAHA